MPTEIRCFFEQYRDAFNALDGNAVARMYAVPSGIAQDAQYKHWSEFEPIRQNMEALCSSYRDRGYLAADFEPTTFLAQGDDFAVVDLKWKIYWNTGAEPWHFKTTYNLVRTGAGWKVLLCTAYAESSLRRAAA